MGNIVKPSRHRKLGVTGVSVVYEPFDPGTGTMLCTQLSSVIKICMIDSDLFHTWMSLNIVNCYV